MKNNGRSFISVLLCPTKTQFFVATSLVESPYGISAQTGNRSIANCTRPWQIFSSITGKSSVWNFAAATGTTYCINCIAGFESVTLPQCSCTLVLPSTRSKDQKLNAF